MSTTIAAVPLSCCADAVPEGLCARERAAPQTLGGATWERLPQPPGGCCRGLGLPDAPQRLKIQAYCRYDTSAGLLAAGLRSCDCRLQLLAVGLRSVAAGVRLHFWLPAAGFSPGCRFQIWLLVAAGTKSGCRTPTWLLSLGLSSAAAGCRLPLWLWTTSTQQLRRICCALQ